MSVRRDTQRGYWLVHIEMPYPDGSTETFRKKSPVQTKRGAEQWEREKRCEMLEDWKRNKYQPQPIKKEVPTFDEWFNGPFWSGRVIARKNKPSEVESKTSIYNCHIKPVLGKLRLDELANGLHIDEFRASLVKKGLSEKRINNILAVVSTPLKYAEEKRVIDRAPRVGLFKIEPPEIEWWEFSEYAKLLTAAANMSSVTDWYLAVCLAGEAGLRIGEVRALKWERDVDMMAKTVTVNEQQRKGITGTPKGRTRRTIPMTQTLYDALKRIQGIHGYVIKNPDGTSVTDDQSSKKLKRICRAAGLSARGWHVLRHAFATHAAMLSVNPWTLMTWLGHKDLQQTMRYVHVATNHMRTIPKEVLQAGDREINPDQKIIKMLGARATAAWQQQASSKEVTG